LQEFTFSFNLDNILGNHIIRASIQYQGSENDVCGKGPYDDNDDVVLSISELGPICNNGIIEEGEQCDDGNNNNNDECTNACLNNVCNDGFLLDGVEQCDGFDFGGQTCSNLGLGTGKLSCTLECTLNTNECITETPEESEPIPEEPEPIPEPIPIPEESINLSKAAIICNDSPCIATTEMVGSRDNIIGKTELNAPNTIDSCSDGTAGEYLQDASIENITVTDLIGSSFKVGDRVQVNIIAHCTNFSRDNVILAYSIGESSFRLIDSQICDGAGLQSFDYNLILGEFEGNHTIRASIQNGESLARTCGIDIFDDNDDVVISVI